MLKPVMEQRKPEGIRIADASFPSPFRSGLEYNPAARGSWNIVHTGMLIPGSHQIYVCAQGCLRGVILTAAEMNAMERMSWVSLREEDMFNGEMEQRVIDGTAHIVGRMPEKPRCVLVYLSCMHMFEGCDFKMIMGELSSMFPEVDFLDCYMIPTMRKSISPDALMKRQLYAPIRKLPTDSGLVSIIGCDRETDKSSELFEILGSAGKRVWEINSCATYDEYLAMGASSLAISYLPVALNSGKAIERRLGIPHLHIPLCYDYNEIEEHYRELCGALGIEIPDFSENIERAERALTEARDTVGDIPIAVDFSAVPRPLGLALLLAEHGFNVRRVYADGFMNEESPAFERLREIAPDLELYPTLDVGMRFARDENCGEWLAVGQRAAYFLDTDKFVNIVEGGGMYGFGGIEKMCGLICDAVRNPKDTRATISLKGLGCESCL